MSRLRSPIAGSRYVSGPRRGWPRSAPSRPPRRDVLLPVELLEEVPGDAEREEVDRHAAHDLVSRADGSTRSRMYEREESPANMRGENADEPAAPLVGSVDPPEGAHQHHPLEADVHDAAPLGNHSAERAERQRRREDEHLRDQSRRRTPREVAGARPRREEPECDPEHARRDAPRPGRRPPRVAAQIPARGQRCRTAIGTRGERASKGGIALRNATKARERSHDSDRLRGRAAGR